MSALSELRGDDLCVELLSPSKKPRLVSFFTRLRELDLSPTISPVKKFDADDASDFSDEQTGSLLPISSAKKFDADNADDAVYAEMIVVSDADNGEYAETIQSADVSDAETLVASDAYNGEYAETSADVEKIRMQDGCCCYSDPMEATFDQAP